MTDYNYLNKLEWIVNLDMLLKPEELDAYIKNTSIALFSPHKNTDVTKQMLIKQPELYTDIDEKTIDADRQYIYNLIRKSVLKKNGGYLLINGLIKIQNKLIEEEKKLVNILNRNFSTDSILGSIFTNTYNLDLVYKNIETDDRNIPKNMKYIQKYICDYLEINDVEDEINILGENNLDTVDYNEIVKNSVLSVTSMPFVDFNKACIGTVDEIIDLIDEFYKVNKFNVLPSKLTEYVNKYLSIYIKNSDQRQNFPLQLNKKYYYINFKGIEENKKLSTFDNQSEIFNNTIYPKFANNILSKVGVNTFVQGPPEKIYNSFVEEQNIKNGPQILFYVETLLFIRILREMTKELEKNGVDNKIVKRICDSYDSLYKYFRNAYSNYFGLSGGNSPYHVDDVGIVAPQYEMENTIITKNVGESKSILLYNSSDGEFNGINREILKKILYTNVEKDLFTKIYKLLLMLKKMLIMIFIIVFLMILF